MVYDLLHDPGLKLPAQDLDASFKSLWGRTLKDKEGGEVQETVPYDGVDHSRVGRGFIDPAEIEGLSPDQVVSLIRTRAKVMAETAFWDAVGSRIEQGFQVRAPLWSLLWTLVKDEHHHHHHHHHHPFMLPLPADDNSVTVMSPLLCILSDR